MRGDGANYSAAAGLPFDDVDLERRLVWIWGSGRSGSTWLLRQLSYPAQLSAKFPAGFRAPPSWPEPLDVVPVDEFLIARHLAPPTGEPIDIGERLVPATLNNYVGEFPGYALSSAFADVWQPEFRRLVLVRLHATIARAREGGVALTDAPHVAIKEVNGSHASDLLMPMFSGSRLLFLVRDGRDVLDSRLHAHEAGGWLAETEGPRFTGPDERLAWVRTASLEWACDMDATVRAYEAHPERLRRMVRYEDLLEGGSGVLAGLFAWLGVERDANAIDRIREGTAFGRVPAEKRGSDKAFRAATPGMWRQNLSADELSAAEEIMAPRLQALSYPLDVESVPATESADERR